MVWSDPEAWYGTEPGYGGYNKELPQDGDDVIIQQRTSHFFCSLVKTIERFSQNLENLKIMVFTKPKDYSVIKSLCHSVEKFKSCVRLELVDVLREFVAVD